MSYNPSEYSISVCVIDAVLVDDSKIKGGSTLQVFKEEGDLEPLQYISIDSKKNVNVPIATGVSGGYDIGDRFDISLSCSVDENHYVSIHASEYYEDILCAAYFYSSGTLVAVRDLYSGYDNEDRLDKSLVMHGGKTYYLFADVTGVDFDNYKVVLTGVVEETDFKSSTCPINASVVMNNQTSEFEVHARSVESGMVDAYAYYQVLLYKLDSGGKKILSSYNLFANKIVDGTDTTYKDLNFGITDFTDCSVELVLEYWGEW